MSQLCPQFPRRRKHTSRPGGTPCTCMNQEECCVRAASLRQTQIARFKADAVKAAVAKAAAATAAAAAVAGAAAAADAIAAIAAVATDKVEHSSKRPKLS